MAPEPVTDPSILGFDADRLNRINDWMARNERIGRIAGSSMLLAKQGKVAHMAYSGQTSVERQSDYVRDTIVRIYSMTKPVTSVALMQLVERGLLHLDIPVSEFFPEFSSCMALVEGATTRDQVVAAPSPTIQQLLTHSSGLSYAFNPGLAAECYAQESISFNPGAGALQPMIKRVAEMPLSFQPGQRWEYSVGIDVIGGVIEKVTGKTLDRYFSEEIFGPLGMTDTSFSISPDKVDRFADCYGKTEGNSFARNDDAQNSAFREGEVAMHSGGGGLLSTLDDYFRFAEMLRLGGALGEERLLSPRTVAFMRQNHLPGDIASMGPASFAEMPMSGMGFGIGGSVLLNPARSGIIGSVGDFSWGGMASTFFWVDPEEQLTGIFFTQLTPSSSYPLRAELKALVHGALVG